MKKKKNKKAPKDPNFRKEQKKYDNPVASREFMIKLIKEHTGPVTYERMIKMLGYKDADKKEAIRRRLIAMVRDGQILKNRRDGYLPIDPKSLVTGKVLGHPDGFGFLQPDDGSKDLFLYPTEMRALMHGDRVVCRISGVDRRGRKEGKVVDILERANKKVVGRFYQESGLYFVTPDNKKLTEDIIVSKEQKEDAEEGQVVEVEIIDFPTKRHQAIGHITKVLGDHLTPGMEIDIAISNYGLPNEWSEKVEEQLLNFSKEVSSSEIKRRKDLREIPLLTIDGEDSKDFDDAVYCQKTPKGWKLIVAIADVAHYVEYQSALDKEAISRGTSVYFPGRVLPMLPELLSNDLCSINPDVERYVLCCELFLDENAHVYRTRFFEAVMRSHARLTYNQVEAILNQDDKTLQDKFKHVLPVLNELYGLYKELSNRRSERGAIEFDRPETRIVFDDNKKIESIVCVERNDAHRIIEECMILANIACAKYLERHKLSGLFRNHEGPKEEKLVDLRKFLSLKGLDLTGGDKPSAEDYSKLINSLDDRADALVIQTVLLRSLKQANYDAFNRGHFGLSLDHYGHFTSPIRRYPDLINHRLIKAHLNKQSLPYNNKDHMSETGGNCSQHERRADEATRDVVDWLKCEFMENKVGTIHDGTITTVTGFGLFVELDDIFVEGLVHITALDKDFYQFDAALHKLVGERTGKQYRLGDRLKIEVSAVNLDERKIDFVLVDESE